MKTVFLAALMLPGVSMANYTCKVDSEVVVLEEYQHPKADITGYRYKARKGGTFVSIIYVDGAYDVFLERGNNTVTSVRAETVDLNVVLDGKGLEVVCPN